MWGHACSGYAAAGTHFRELKTKGGSIGLGRFVSLKGHGSASTLSYKHDHLVLLQQEQELADHNTTRAAGHPEQPTERQLEPEQRKPKQTRLFLESDTGEEAEQCQAAPAGGHAPAAAQEHTTQRQGKAAKPGQAAKAQNQQPSKARKRPDERLQEVSLVDDDEDVPSTYNNMPSRRQQQPRHDGYADENAAPQEEDSQGGVQPAAQKAAKPKCQKHQQKKEMTAQVISPELDFDGSDAESDEYEPTQAKAAVKRAAQKAAQPKSPTWKSRHPQQGKQQGKAKQPGKAAKATTQEGQAKRPRGRPRKAPPQHEQQPKQARKRKAVNVTDGEDPNEEEGGKVAKPRKQNPGMLKAAALLPDVDDSEGQDLQVWLACLETSACWSSVSSLQTIGSRHPKTARDMHSDMARIHHILACISTAALELVHTITGSWLLQSTLVSTSLVEYQEASLFCAGS